MERELSYDEIHELFHETIKELMHSLRPALNNNDMEAEILDTLGRLVASWDNKDNIRKSIMVIAAMFLEMGEKLKNVPKTSIDK